MRLCIDIGNTALKFGLFEENELRISGHSFDMLKQIDCSSVSDAILSSVAHAEKVCDWLTEVKIPYLILDASFSLPFTHGYHHPATLGTDRIAAVAGAIHHFPNSNCLVITAGSCITYNVLSKENVFLGGAISPGIGMRFKALNTFTAKLPLISLEKEETPQWIGQTTSDAIKVGVHRAILNEMEGFISQFQSDFENLNILICGGDAPFLVSHLKNNIFAHPPLILEGLNHILQLNANKLS